MSLKIIENLKKEETPSLYRRCIEFLDNINGWIFFGLVIVTSLSWISGIISYVICNTLCEVLNFDKKQADKDLKDFKNNFALLNKNEKLFVSKLLFNHINDLNLNDKALKYKKDIFHLLLLNNNINIKKTLEINLEKNKEIDNNILRDMIEKNKNEFITKNIKKIDLVDLFAYFEENNIKLNFKKVFDLTLGKNSLDYFNHIYNINFENLPFFENLKSKEEKLIKNDIHLNSTNENTEDLNNSNINIEKNKIQHLINLGFDNENYQKMLDKLKLLNELDLKEETKILKEDINKDISTLEGLINKLSIAPKTEKIKEQASYINELVALYINNIDLIKEKYFLEDMNISKSIKILKKQNNNRTIMMNK